MKILPVLAGVLAMALAGTAQADGALTAKRISQLYHAYYGMGVIEYCGLNSDLVNDGYERQIRYLLMSADLDAESVKRIRFSGWREADYQFDNYGLSGFKTWCRKDGLGAEIEFLAFRAGEVGWHNQRRS
jgi:hypothetical protein